MKDGVRMIEREVRILLKGCCGFERRVRVEKMCWEARGWGKLDGMRAGLEKGTRKWRKTVVGR
ncbi:hypothetical protein [Bartonella sp. MR90HLJMH]|uniref:hypothetical protein n=1 Tax=Bartonella sp. MR90HLJMH TaxID=3243559 RepID=UPI0035CED0F7